MSDAQSTDKQAKIDPVRIARYGTGGALAGGTSAALLSMVHSLNLAKRQREDAKVPTETDENTIVLRLPPKLAAVEASCKKKIPKNKAKSVSKKVPAKSYRKGYYKNQGMKKADWQTMAGSVMAATGGGMLGYHVVNKAYQNALDRKLKNQEEAAKTELLNTMVARPKVASTWLEDTFTVPQLKSAQATPTVPTPVPAAGGFKMPKVRENSRFSYLDAPFAAAALLTMLGTGGAGYVTKKVLDSHDDEANEEFKPPRVQRIVFKSAAYDLDEGEELATPEDLDCIKAALVITMDYLSGREVLRKEALLAPHMDSLYKNAQENVNPIIELLKSNPELRKQVQRIGMDQYPMMKHLKPLLNVPGMSEIADSKLYDKVDGFFQGRDMSKLRSLMQSAGDEFAPLKQYMSRMPSSMPSRANIMPPQASMVIPGQQQSWWQKFNDWRKQYIRFGNERVQGGSGYNMPSMPSMPPMPDWAKKPDVNSLPWVGAKPKQIGPNPVSPMAPDGYTPHKPTWGTPKLPAQSGAPTPGAQVPPAIAPGYGKAAGFLLPSFAGSMLAERAIGGAMRPKAKPLPPSDEVKAEQTQEILNNIQLSATDPDAAAYLEENQDRIRMLMGQLAPR